MDWESWEKRTKCTNLPNILEWDKNGIEEKACVSMV